MIELDCRTICGEYAEATVISDELCSGTLDKDGCIEQAAHLLSVSADLLDYAGLDDVASIINRMSSSVIRDDESRDEYNNKRKIFLL